MYDYSVQLPEIKGRPPANQNQEFSVAMVKHRRFNIFGFWTVGPTKQAI